MFDALSCLEAGVVFASLCMGFYYGVPAGMEAAGWKIQLNYYRW